MSLLLLLIVLLLVVGGLPNVGYAHGYGYYPSGVGTVILIVLVVLLLTGRL